MKQKALNYWQHLQPRERRTLLIGGVALLLFAIYGLVLEPYGSAMGRLEQTVAERRALLTWMEQSAREVESLRGGRPAPRRGAGGSLLAVADSTAKAQGLGPSLKRVQPDGEQAVRVWMEKVSFDQLLVWLDQLETKHAVRVTGLVVERREETGRVDARLVLEGLAQ